MQVMIEVKDEAIMNNNEVGKQQKELSTVI